MPYKYIGRTTNTKGNTLWEIVGNLKNFGVGRIVLRSLYEKYPEPSYLRILKVEPLQCPEVQNVDNRRKVRVLVDKIFRGKSYPAPVTIESVSYKADYRLVPKDEEEKYCKNNIAPKELPVYPRTIEMPPVMQDFIIREKKAKGEDLHENLKVEVVYKKSGIERGRFRVANEGEEATITFDINMRKIPNLSLYKDVKV